MVIRSRLAAASLSLTGAFLLSACNAPNSPASGAVAAMQNRSALSGVSLAATASPTPLPLNVGPVSLNGNTYASAATITANALGSGEDGPLTAQTGMTINASKDNWWTGGNVGEVDGLNIILRQNGAGSDGSGILINAQNQGNGFLSATEFESTIVNASSNTLTYGIDVQEGVLDHLNGDYYGAVYTADYGSLSSGILIQNNSGASWQNAIQYSKDGAMKFSVDGSGNISGSSLYVGAATLNGDPTNGSADIGNLANASATPYVDFNGFGKSGNVRLINDANGQFTVTTQTGGSLQVKSGGVFTSGSFHVNLATPSSSSSPCVTGQIGADENYVYVCVATNKWRRSALSAF